MQTPDRLPSVRPVGHFAQILLEFGATDEVSRNLTKRVSHFVGIPNGIPHDEIIETIVNSLINGLPDWPNVIKRLTQRAKDIRRIDW